MQTGFRMALALMGLGFCSVACAPASAPRAGSLEPAPDSPGAGTVTTATASPTTPPTEGAPASTSRAATASVGNANAPGGSTTTDGVTVSTAAHASTTSGAAPPPPWKPPSVSPPFERSAHTGDGDWVVLTEPSWKHHLERPIAYRTRLHPHPVSRFVRMDVAAIDLRSVSLHWVVGSKDAGAERLSNAMKPGFVAAPDQQRLLVIFNGGFQARHGWWGMHSHGVSLVALKEHGCTVALTASGRVRLGEWASLQHEADAFETLRQTPPCLVSNGEIHPALLSGNTKSWAGQNPQRKTRRRSALGIDPSQGVLYYAIGTETSAVDLARGMAALGAETALQLDINWSWTRFLIVGKQNGRPRVTQTLIEDTVHGKNEYFTWPADRDFFYLTVRGD